MMISIRMKVILLTLGCVCTTMAIFYSLLFFDKLEARYPNYQNIWIEINAWTVILLFSLFMLMGWKILFWLQVKSRLRIYFGIKPWLSARKHADWLAEHQLEISAYIKEREKLIAYAKQYRRKVNQGSYRKVRSTLKLVGFKVT